jgi:hypothetical protein
MKIVDPRKLDALPDDTSNPCEALAFIPDPKVMRAMRRAYYHLNKVCEFYSEKDDNGISCKRRYCEYCPLQWKENVCLHHALRFWT